MPLMNLFLRMNKALFPNHKNILQQHMNYFSNPCKEHNMKIRTTEAMTVSRTKRKPGIYLHGQQLKQITEF